MNLRPFAAIPASGKKITVSASSQRTVLDTRGTKNQIRVANLGTDTVWIEFGDSAVTASMTTGIPIPAGRVEILSSNPTADLYVAVIAAGATGDIWFNIGEGI